MRAITNYKKKKKKSIKNCGGKKGRGCNTWGGATKLVTTIKIAA
jgi:hypothetical protein